MGSFRYKLINIYRKRNSEGERERRKENEENGSKELEEEKKRGIDQQSDHKFAKKY